MIDKLRELNEIEDKKAWLDEISKSRNSVFHIRRSKTAMIAVTVAVLQMSVTVVLMLKHRMLF